MTLVGITVLIEMGPLIHLNPLPKMQRLLLWLGGLLSAVESVQHIQFHILPRLYSLNSHSTQRSN